jgi:hypothetical protein
MEAAEASAVATLLAASGTSPEGPSSPLRGSGVNKRWRITPRALALLECVFARAPCPSTTTRDALAAQLGATPRQVQVWFQNKRQRRAIKKREAEDSPTGKPTEEIGFGDPMVPTTSSTAQILGMAGAAAHFMIGDTSTWPALVRDPSDERGRMDADVQQQPKPPPPPSWACAAAPAPSVAPPSLRCANSLADLASAAEAVESIESLTGRRACVSALKDFVAHGRALGEQPAYLSPFVSLTDASYAIGAAPVAQPQHAAAM